MTTAIRNLAETVVQLPPKERAFLAERLLDSLEDAELEHAWLDEAKRRRNEVLSGRVRPIPADEVYRRIEQMLNK